MSEIQVEKLLPTADDVPRGLALRLHPQIDMPRLVAEMRQVNLGHPVGGNDGEHCPFGHEAQALLGAKDRQGAEKARAVKGFIGLGQGSHCESIFKGRTVGFAPRTPAGHLTDIDKAFQSRVPMS